MDGALELEAVVGGVDLHLEHNGEDVVVNAVVDVLVVNVRHTEPLLQKCVIHVLHALHDVLVVSIASTSITGKTDQRSISSRGCCRHAVVVTVLHL